jgi:hypothetical protein
LVLVFLNRRIMEMDEHTEIVKKLIANDFAEIMKGKMHQSKIDAAVAKMLGPSTGYAATTYYTQVVFYFYVSAYFTGNPPPSMLYFYGNGGGIGTPGGGASPGTIYTDSIPTLLSNTVAFQLNLASAYFNVNFFDDSSNLLGSFHGVNLPMLGIGGGSGSWQQGPFISR